MGPKSKKVKRFFENNFEKIQFQPIFLGKIPDFRDFFLNKKILFF